MFVIDESGSMSEDQAQVRARARAVGVAHCTIPAVCVGNFAQVRALAHAQGDSYALGIHPLFVPQAQDGDLQVLEDALRQHFLGAAFLTIRRAFFGRLENQRNAARKIARLRHIFRGP